MPKCSYCGKQYEFPRGLTLVKTDGNIVYLCSAKCRKNMLMKKRKVRWISKMAENKGLAVKAVSRKKDSKKAKKTKKKGSSKSKGKK